MRGACCFIRDAYFANKINRTEMKVKRVGGREGERMYLSRDTNIREYSCMRVYIILYTYVHTVRACLHVEHVRNIFTDFVRVANYYLILPCCGFIYPAVSEIPPRCDYISTKSRQHSPSKLAVFNLIIAAPMRKLNKNPIFSPRRYN